MRKYQWKGRSYLVQVQCLPVPIVFISENDDPVEETVGEHKISSPSTVVCREEGTAEDRGSADPELDSMGVDIFGENYGNQHFQYRHFSETKPPSKLVIIIIFQGVFLVPNIAFWGPQRLPILVLIIFQLVQFNEIAIIHF